MNYRLLILSVLTSMPVAAKSDKIIQMIRRIDPYGLNELHIPGFFIKADEKKRYLGAAREVTDKAYRSLHNVSLYDFVRLMKGAIKGAAGIGSAYLAYLYSKDMFDIAQFAVGDEEQRRLVQDWDFSRRATYTIPNKWLVYGVLGGLSAYLLSDARAEFSNVYNKQQRVLAYHNALAQEAYIARLPVCDVGACETILEDEAA